MPGNWQENTGVRSNSSILASKAKYDGVKVKKVSLQEQLVAANQNYKKLTDEINRLEKRLAGSTHGSDLRATLEIKLKKRKEMYTRLWSKLNGPNGLIVKAQKEQHKEMTIKARKAEEQKEHNNLVHATVQAIEAGKRVLEERPRPSVLKAKIDTSGGIRRVVTVGKKRFSEQEKNNQIPVYEPVGLGRLLKKPNKGEID